MNVLKKAHLPRRLPCMAKQISQIDLDFHAGVVVVVVAAAAAAVVVVVVVAVHTS
jgi:hypothetical protein